MSYGSKRRVAKAILTLVSVAGVGLVLVPAAVVATVIDYAVDRDPGGVASPVAWLLVALGAARAARHVPKVSGRKLPGRWRVRWSLVTIAYAGVAALCLLPRSPLWPLLAAGVALVVARAATRACRQAWGFTTWTERLRTATLLAWERDRPLVVGAAAAALAVGTVLSSSGVWVAGVLAAALALAPARLHAARAAGIERVRGDVQHPLAGALPGWDPALAEVGAAPVRVDVDPDDLTVREVEFPLPPGWQSSATERLEDELGDRLARWSTSWVVEVSPTERKATAVPAEPLPARVPYGGWAAEGREVLLGVGRVSAGMVRADPTLRRGQLFDLCWDLAKTPHGIAVGDTGSGKSVAVQVVMAQWSLAGHELRLVDPKKVEFSRWHGRPGVTAISTELEEHAAVIEGAAADMEERYRLMREHGVNDVTRLPEELRPTPLLLVVDESVELLQRTKGKSEEHKRVDELKSRCDIALDSVLRLGRAAGVHVLLAAQRADREVVSGQKQNNVRARILCNAGAAGQTERQMIGLSEVEPTGVGPGRAVAATIQTPEAEVQIAYLDPADLDEYVPVRRPTARTGGGRARTAARGATAAADPPAPPTSVGGAAAPREPEPPGGGGDDDLARQLFEEE